MPRISVTSAPDEHPVTVDECATHCLIDRELTEDEEAWFTTAIATATDAAENYTRRALVERDLRLWLDAGEIPTSDVIELRYPPVISVDAITMYDDDDGETITEVGDYLVDTASIPPRVILKEYTWSYAMHESRLRLAVAIDYTAGYGDAEDVPAEIRLAIMQHVAAMFAIRETGIEGGTASGDVSVVPAEVRASLDKYKIVRL